MSKIENLIQQIRTQIGSEFISTDIVGIDGLSIAGDATSQGFNLGSNAVKKLTPLPPLVYRGTDFSIKPDAEIEVSKNELEVVNSVFDSTDSSARFAAVMKLSANVSNKLAMGKVEDNLITTDKVYILSRFLGDNSYFWVLSVTRDATLGTIRMLMNEFAPLLWEAIPH
jgi:predicted regulator of Ras-like GTPase activity (Roadblock/LC7/MglB family)